jgi:hypothetical protein
MIIMNGMLQVAVTHPKKYDGEVEDIFACETLSGLCNSETAVLPTDFKIGSKQVSDVLVRKPGE